MIYRKWSLMTGPAVLIGGIFATVVVADLLFVQNDWLHKSDDKKQQSAVPAKLSK